jgi:hypothetical protein
MNNHPTSTVSLRWTLILCGLFAIPYMACGSDSKRGGGGGDDDDDSGYCNDQCSTAKNSTCEDGYTGSVSGSCVLGTDCEDCGARTSSEPMLIPDDQLGEPTQDTYDESSAPESAKDPNNPGCCKPFTKWCNEAGTVLIHCPANPGGGMTSCHTMVTPCAMFAGPWGTPACLEDGPKGVGCYLAATGGGSGTETGTGTATGTGTGGNVSPDCASSIAQQRGQLTSGIPCLDACLDTYLSCLEETNCAPDSSCTTNFQSCGQGCVG